MPSTLHQMSDDELPAVLSLLAATGGTVRSPDSWRQDRMTALVLGERGVPYAVMPMARRRLPASAGREVSVGWLSSNQFATRMSWRRQTRGTSPDWSRLLPEIDALMVMRRDENSLAARWYQQTGFSDVLAVRCLYLEMSAPPPAPAAAQGRYQVQVVTPSRGQWDAARWQSQMLSVYRDVFSAFGGAPWRHENFWEPALANHFYREHYQFQIIGLWSHRNLADESPGTSNKIPQQLMGYAIVGWSGWHSKRPRMDILELATRQWDTAVADDLIRTTCQLAWSKNVRQVRAVVSMHDPYRGHLARTGFADRWGYTMQAKWLSPQPFLDRISASLPEEVGNFWVQISSPGEVPLVIGRGSRSAPAVTISLQGHARAITRLLLNRLDLPAALQDGSLIAGGPVSEQDIVRLSQCFPWTPWVFHLFDYI